MGREEEPKGRGWRQVGGEEGEKAGVDDSLKGRWHLEGDTVKGPLGTFVRMSELKQQSRNSQVLTFLRAYKPLYAAASNT